MEIINSPTFFVFAAGQILAAAFTYGYFKSEFKTLRRDLDEIKQEAQTLRRLINKYVFKIEE